MSAAEKMENLLNKATHHHVTINDHHPEFHYPGNKKDLLLSNSKDRDDPLQNKIIDATIMPMNDMAEMVCDWCAMSEERHNSPMDWAKKILISDGNLLLDNQVLYMH